MTVITMPTDIRFGKVIGRFVLSVSDGVDADNLPDAVPATGRIIFTPVGVRTKATSPVPTTVIKRTMSCQINDDGWIVDQQNNMGVWLLEGTYKVTYQLSEVDIKTHDIYVMPEHTEASPLDLYYSQPPSGEILSPTQYAELDARLSGIEMTGVGLHAGSHEKGGSDEIDAVNGVAIQPPGGWVDMDANVLLEAGRYALYAGSSQNIPSAGGGVVGILEVLPRLTGASTQIYQRWTVMGDASGNPIGEWIRGTYDSGTTWGSWLRVDNTALKPADIGALEATSDVIPNNQDLNTLTEPGRYLQGSSSYTTLALNYPIDGFAGNIEVLHSNVMTMQRATYFTNNAKFGVWVRVLYGSGGTWGPWKRLVTDDDPRLKDTGWRDITALVAIDLDAAAPGRLLIRREGSRVILRFDALKPSANIGASVVLTVPAGFRAGFGRMSGLVSVQTSIDTNYRVASYSTVVRVAGRWTSSGVWTNGWITTDELTGDLSWYGDEPFPAQPYPGTPA